MGSDSAANPATPQEDWMTATEGAVTPRNGAIPPEVGAAPDVDTDPLGHLPLFAGLDAATRAEFGRRAETIELDAGSYLFHAGDSSDSLYVLRRGRLQVIQEDIVLRELGRGEVVGELGLLIDAPRSASVRALRDSTLLRLSKTQFDQIADRGVLTALVRVLATQLHQAPPPTVSRPTSPEVVVALIGVDAGAPVREVAAAVVSELSPWVHAVDPGRIDRDGLERAERAADRVVLHASVEDADWRQFCVRVADRIVLVAADPAPHSARLPARAAGADLILAGAPASREHRHAWEELITPRSVHDVRLRLLRGDLRPLAARIAGRSVGLVLSGGGARAFAHLGVLEELELAGISVDRLAGTSMGAVIAALAASGLDTAGADAYIYEYFLWKNPISEYTSASKGLIRGRRTLALLHEAFGDRLVEELPKQFRCVSVDLLAKQAVVHRYGPLAEVVGCSLRLPGLYPPQLYEGRLHVDGGVLNNLPVSALAGPEGPVVAVSIGLGGGDLSDPAGHSASAPKVPGIADTLIRTMTIGSQTLAVASQEQAQIVIRPDIGPLGLLDFHEVDAARDAGRAATREALPQIDALLNT